MRKYIPGLIQFVFCMATTQPSFSHSEKFGQLIYTPPAGWKVEKYQNGVQLITKGPIERELLTIQIMQPVNFSGAIKQAFEKSY